MIEIKCISTYVALAIVIVICIVWEDPDRLWVSLVCSVYLFNRFSVCPKAIKNKVCFTSNIYVWLESSIHETTLLTKMEIK